MGHGDAGVGAVGLQEGQPREIEYASYVLTTLDRQPEL